MWNYAFRKLAALFMSVAMPLVGTRGRNTETLEGFHICGRAGEYSKQRGYQRILIITDQTVTKLGLVDETIAGLRQYGIAYRIFDGVTLEPSHETVLSARDAGVDFCADCVVAVGGGSVLDCAKIACIGIKNPKMSPRRLTGLQLGTHPGTIPLIAIPTTAGTGAEVTVGSMLTDEHKRAKHTADGPKVKAALCILDGMLTLHCPKELTACAGIDALSHGLEAYLGPVYQSRKHRRELMECVRLVLENLPSACLPQENPTARLALCRAANLGGYAINRCTAGYAHSFAHALGAVYHIPHGAAIAMVLPCILRYEKSVCMKKLADLAVYCGLAEGHEPEQTLAERLILAVEGLIGSCEIARHPLLSPDYEDLTSRIFQDSLLMIPPKVMHKDECLALLKELTQPGQGR